MAEGDLFLLDNFDPGPEFPWQEARVIDYSARVKVPQGTHLVPFLRLLRERSLLNREEFLRLQTSIASMPVGRKNLEEFLEIEPGYSYFYCTLFAEASPYKVHFLQELYKFFTLREFLKPGGRLTLASTDPILRSMIGDLCIQKGTQLRLLGKELKKTQKADFKRSFLGALVHLIGKQTERIRFFPSPRKSKRDKLIMSFFPPADFEMGQVSSPYFQDLEKLIDASGYDWLFYFAGNREKLKEVRKARNCPGVHFLDSYFDLIDLASVVYEFTTLHFKFGKVLDLQFKVDGIDFTPLLGESMIDSLSFQLAEFLATRRKFRNLLQSKEAPKKIVYPMEGQPHEQALILETRECRTAGFCHSTVRPQQLNYFSARGNLGPLIPDQILVNGDNSKEPMEDQGHGYRLIPVEANRYNYLESLKDESEFKGPGKLELLITTAVDPDETKFQLQMFLDSGLEKSFEKVLLKPHPHLDIQSVLDEMQTAFPFSIVEKPMGELLKDRPVLFVSNTSSVIIEALMSGCQVITFVQENQFSMLAIEKHPNLKIISSAKELSSIEFPIRGEESTVRLDSFFYLDKRFSRWKQFLTEW